MTLADLNTLLTGISGYSNKVAYYAFPEGKAPSLPFICYLENGSRNFSADGKPYHEIKSVDVELYTETKDLAQEALVETALTNASCVWSKKCNFIDDEKCWQIIYSIEV